MNVIRLSAEHEWRGVIRTHFWGETARKFIYKPQVRGLRSPGMLRSADWCLTTNVSGQPIGPILNSKAVQENP